jgi:uncharacterized membrane protein YkoI
MIDTKILISVVIVLLIGVAAASYQVTTKTLGIWQPSVSQAQTSSEVGSSGTSSSGQRQTGSQASSLSSGQSGTGGVNVNISPSKAKTIALSHIDTIAVPNASTGTPKLIVLDGKQAYNVPILINNIQVGEIVVDADTGNVIEGAGGVGNGSNG